MRFKVFVYLIVCITSISCWSKKESISKVEDSPKAEEVVKIMTFNVENLFDTKHDKGKKDHTFLPKSYKKQKKHIKSCKKIRRKKWRDQCLHWDWSQKVLEEKMQRIASSVKQVNAGLGPDILVLQEVENINILETLRKEHLAGMGYQESILIEGKDVRGIDVAFISKFPSVGRAKLTMVPFSDISTKRKSDTRGILQQDFKLPTGELITGFAVHFPAPYHPYKLRVQSYKFLNELVSELPPGRLAFAAGDFNTPSKENDKYEIWDTYTKTHWLIPHQDLCDNCKGTNYYAPKKSWSFLDTILVSKSIARLNWQVSKVYVANKSAHQSTTKGRPNSFKLQGSNVYGVSDHWPLVVELSYKK